MSAKLLIVALLCAVAYAQAAGIVTIGISSSADCSEPYSSIDFTSGECQKPTSGSTGSAYYFDSANVYSVSYFDANCTVIHSITQNPTGCGKTEFGTSYTTNGTSATMPFSFPPDGYSTSSEFRNVTAAGAKNTACSVVSGVVEVKSASNSAYCAPREDSTWTTQPSSTQTFCNSEGTAYGTVIFSDATCSTPAEGSSQTLEACMVNGRSAVAASCGATATFPDNIPTQGWLEYTNEDCSSANPVTQYVGPTCFDSQTLVCGAVNGTDGYITYTQYSIGSGAHGSCGTQTNQQVVLAGTCVKYGSSYRKYTCQADGPGASASTASVSVVATLLAAVAAVFAVRSL